MLARAISAPLVSLLVVTGAARAEVLFDFEAAAQMDAVRGASGSTVSAVPAPGREGTALRVDYPAAVDWPYVEVTFAGPLDWSAQGWFSAEVYSDSDEPRSIEFEFRDAAGHKYKAPRNLPPRAWTHIEVFVRHMAAGYDAGGWAGEPIDVTNVASLAILRLQPRSPVSIFLDDLAIAEATPLAAPSLEARSVGEGAELEWSEVEGAEEYWLFRGDGAVVDATDSHRLAAVRARRFVDTSALIGREYSYAVRAFSFRSGVGPLSAAATHTQSNAKRTALPDRDAYGGMVGADWEATGWFRVEKRDGRWWMVDPEGHPWFGVGVCVVGVGDTYTRVTGREERFSRWMPTREDPAYGDAWTPPYGYGPYGLDGDGAVLSPYVHGMVERYGAGWREQFGRLAAERLGEWGLNHYAAWGATDALAAGTLPYVSFFGPEGRTIGGRNTPDPFDPRFEASLREAPEKLAWARDDKRLIGMFSANEIDWYGDWQKGLDLVDLVQAAPDDQPARAAWLAFLRARYADVGALNAEWGTAFADWAALEASREDLPGSDGCTRDKDAFFRELVDRYFRLTTEWTKRALPNHLTLGVRVAGSGPGVIDEIAAKYCDVLSYNVYPPADAPTPLPTRYRSWGEFPDKPLLIGEFCARASDSGLPNRKAAGPVLATQEDRGWYYQRYVSAALASPNVVGVGWFQYIDEPATGRFGDGVDGGEDSNMGWLDVDDKPYEGFIRFARMLNENLYVLAQPR